MPHEPKGTKGVNSLDLSEKLYDDLTILQSTSVLEKGNGSGKIESWIPIDFIDLIAEISRRSKNMANNQ